MKGWAKGVLIASAVCVSVGFGICIGGWAMGGRFGRLLHRGYWIAEERFWGGETPGDHETPPTEDGSGPDREEGAFGDGDAGTDREGGGSRERGERFEGPLTCEGRLISGLEMVVMGGRVEIRADDSADGVQIICDNDDYQCSREIDEDKLEIEIRPRRSAVWSPADYEDWDETAAVILIPAGAFLEEVELEVKGGVLSAGEIHADKLDLELEAGLLEVYGGAVRKLDGECKAGKLIYRGSVQWEMKAECSAGAITCQIEGKEEDFNYDIEALGGSILIGGTEQGELRRETMLEHPGAGKRAELECRAGAIGIEFYENREGE